MGFRKIMEKLEQNHPMPRENEGNEVGKEFPAGQEGIQTSLTRSDKSVTESKPWVDPGGF